MTLEILLVAAGLVILILAGDVLVRGAVALSLRLGVPALIVSLTIVAFGTSAPELIIAVQSALEGAPGIAFGNVVGSNIANVWLVLGVPALIAPLQQEGRESCKGYLYMLAASLLFIAACAFGPLTIIHGFVFLAVLAFILWDTARSNSGAAEEEVDEFNAEISGTRIAVYIILGLIGLPLGAELLIRGAVGIAESVGLPEAVIGLTIVAAGTSLPELATTVIAALRRQADVAIGNVIGSNLFNILAIMGVASFFGPLHAPAGFITFDFWAMLLASIMLAPFIFRDFVMGRVIGLIFLAIYAAYIISTLMFAGHM